MIIDRLSGMSKGYQQSLSEASERQHSSEVVAYGFDVVGESPGLWFRERPNAYEVGVSWVVAATVH